MQPTLMGYSQIISEAQLEDSQMLRGRFTCSIEAVNLFVKFGSLFCQKLYGTNVGIDCHCCLSGWGEFRWVVESFSGVAQDMSLRDFQIITKSNQFTLFAIYKGLPKDRTNKKLQQNGRQHFRTVHNLFNDSGRKQGFKKT